MSTEENKTIVRRYMEDLWNAGNLSIADQIIAADFVNHNPTSEETPDREGIKQGIRAFHLGFSDLQFIIEDMIAEGDKIAIRGTFHGIHTGKFAGVSATGQSITFDWSVILRIKSSRIIDRWACIDELGFLTRLGVIPPMGESKE